MQQLRAIARDKGVHPGRLGKVALVRAIQRQEGNFDCFATARTQCCDQGECLWQPDCFALAKMNRVA